MFILYQEFYLDQYMNLLRWTWFHKEYWSPMGIIRVESFIARLYYKINFRNENHIKNIFLFFKFDFFCYTLYIKANPF